MAAEKSIAPAELKQLRGRIELMELRARDIEAQARFAEARIRLAEAQSKLKSNRLPVRDK